MSFPGDKSPFNSPFFNQDFSHKFDDPFFKQDLSHKFDDPFFKQDLSKKFNDPFFKQGFNAPVTQPPEKKLERPNNNSLRINSSPTISPSFTPSISSSIMPPVNSKPNNSYSSLTRPVQPSTTSSPCTSPSEPSPKQPTPESTPNNSPSTIPVNKQNVPVEIYTQEEEAARKLRLEEEAVVKKQRQEKLRLEQEEAAKKLRLEEEEAAAKKRRLKLLEEENMPQEVAVSELELLRKNGKLKDLEPEEVKEIETEIISFAKAIQKVYQERMHSPCSKGYLESEMRSYKCGDSCMQNFERKKRQVQKNILSEKLFNSLMDKNDQLGADLEHLGIIISQEEIQRCVNSIWFSDFKKLFNQIISGSKLSENLELWKNRDFKEILEKVLSDKISSISSITSNFSTTYQRDCACLDLSQKYQLTLNVLGTKYENGNKIEPQITYTYHHQEEKITNKNKNTLYL